MSNQKIFGTNNYIEYQPGDLNVIICIPHGGSLKPSSIPNRDAGAMVDGACVYNHLSGKKDPKKCPIRYKRDEYTKELGTMIADQLHLLTGRRPHVVINHLYRGKMDANTEMEKATFGVSEAVEAWHNFHNFIDQAKSSIFGPALFLDIHGHAHPEDWVELGYTISSEKLSSRSYTHSDSSIRSLAGRNGLTDDISFQNLIHGPKSFGGLLEKCGIKVVPSISHPAPHDKHFYSGGYNTLRHGSRHGGHVDAIQIESPRCLRRKESAPKYAADLASVISQYLDTYFTSHGHAGKL